MKTVTALDFETLVELYYQPVFAFAIKLCGKIEQALELTQHTFCLALSHERFLRERHNAKSWLFTLVFREFLKERRFKTKSISSRNDRNGRRSEIRSATPIVDALRKVRSELRGPLVLFYARDLSFSQIAEFLGTSVEAVLTLLSKGREELGLALAPGCPKK